MGTTVEMTAKVLAELGIEKRNAGGFAGEWLGSGTVQPVVSPVDGEVIAYNAAPDAHLDPYGSGWLFRVQPDAWKRSRAQLLEGAAAREWLEDQGRRLAARLSPEPQPVLQDGGAPVHGIAREIDPEHWDDVAREFLRTQENQGKP